LVAKGMAEAAVPAPSAAAAAINFLRFCFMLIN
jgi:hypothetical protein